jgi:DNA-binding NarL/FixJ family response regulator
MARAWTELSARAAMPTTRARVVRRKERPLRITLVDDDEGVHLVVREMLADAPKGWRVEKCLNGCEALDRIPAVPPDVVLMDIMMPGPSGIECTRRLRLAAPAVPVVMLTASPAASHIIESMAAGACGYILKPVAAQTLAQAIRQAANGAFPLCQRA